MAMIHVVREHLKLELSRVEIVMIQHRTLLTHLLFSAWACNSVLLC